MFRYVPAGSGAGLTSYLTENASVVSPQFQPAWKAATLAAMMSGLRANLDLRKLSVPSEGRSYSQESMPSANMFFARSASFLEISNDSSALKFIEEIGTAGSLYCSTEPC